VRGGTGPNSAPTCPDRAIGHRGDPGDHHPMQAASGVPSRARARRPRSAILPVVGLVAAGLAWLAIALVTAWLVFATPLLAGLVSLDARGDGSPVVGSLVLALALTAPACFAFLGLTRLAGAAGRVMGARPSLPPVARMAALLPPGCTVIPAIRLPDGRRIPDVVLGPHGIAFFERLPPAEASRRVGGRWEVRFADRSWRPIENPFERAARDGDRLRRHLEAAERDFVVRVQPAVIGDAAANERGDGCPPVALEEVPGWLAALPVQRGLTPERQAHVREVLEALA